MMEHVDEQVLLDRARAGDGAALGELLQAYQRRVYNVCLRMVGNRDDAAELAQDTLLKVVQHIGDFRGQSGLGTWVTRIAMNGSISHLRKRKLRRTASLEAPSSANGRGEADEGATLRRRLADEREPGPARRVQESEGHDRLQRAILALDEEHRAVLVLRDIDELDYAQIAEALELPLGTVKSRLFRARLALREQVMKQESASGDDAGEGRGA